MWVVCVNHKGEDERAAFVHACSEEDKLWIIKMPSTKVLALVRCYGQSEVKEIGGIREIRLHRRRQIQLCQIYGKSKVRIINSSRNL